MTRPDDSEVLDAVRAGLLRVLAPPDLAQTDLANLAADTALLSLPIDSAVLMALINELEDAFGVYIDEESAFSFTTVGDIGDFLRRRLTERRDRG